MEVFNLEGTEDYIKINKLSTKTPSKQYVAQTEVRKSI